MTECGYEPIDHTADLGLRIWAPDPAGLYRTAAEGMLSLCVDPGTLRPGPERRVSVDGEDRVELMFEWLREILYRLNVSRVFWCPLRIERIADNRLDAVVGEDPVDPDRHELRHEVKAVTYHGLTVEQADGRWAAEIIFDV